MDGMVVHDALDSTSIRRDLKRRRGGAAVLLQLTIDFPTSVSFAVPAEWRGALLWVNRFGRRSDFRLRAAGICLHSRAALLATSIGCGSSHVRLHQGSALSAILWPIVDGAARLGFRRNPELQAATRVGMFRSISNHRSLRVLSRTCHRRVTFDIWAGAGVLCQRPALRRNRISGEVLRIPSTTASSRRSTGRS